MRAISLSLVLIAAVGLATGVSARLYKWTDEEGNVHFTQTLPPGKKVEPMELRYHKVPDESAQRELDDLKQKAGIAPAGTAPQEKQEGKVEPDPETLKEVEKQNEENCQRAKKNLAVLQSARGPVSETDAEGKKTFLDAAAMEKKRAETEEQIKQYCK